MAKQGRERPQKDQASTKKHSKAPTSSVKKGKMVSREEVSQGESNETVEGKGKQCNNVPTTPSPACPMADPSSVASTPVMMMANLEQYQVWS